MEVIHFSDHSNTLVCHYVGNQQLKYCAQSLWGFRMDYLEHYRGFNKFVGVSWDFGIECEPVCVRVQYFIVEGLF